MYSQHHIKRHNDQHVAQIEDLSHRHNQQCEKTMWSWSGHVNPPHIRSMNLRVSSYDKKMLQWRPSKRWRGVLNKIILGEPDLEEDKTRQAMHSPNLIY